MQLAPQQLSDVLAALRAAGESAGHEKRRFTRMEVQTTITVGTVVNQYVSRRYSALTRDISGGGVGLLQYLHLERNQQLIVCLPCAKAELFIVSNAAFCRPLAEGLFGIGVTFERLADKPMIEQFRQVQQHERDRIRDSILS
jgi:hypothetical protein